MMSVEARVSPARTSASTSAGFPAKCSAATSTVWPGVSWTASTASRAVAEVWFRDDAKDAVSRCEARHAGANGVDDAREVLPEDDREAVLHHPLHLARTWNQRRLRLTRSAAAPTRCSRGWATSGRSTSSMSLAKRA